MTPSSQAACVLLLALLFRVIARASDDFFSCILSQISQDLGLPPRLAGVTLLALGNGAPDLSASIEAVKSGAPAAPAATAGHGHRRAGRAPGRGAGRSAAPPIQTVGCAGGHAAAAARHRGSSRCSFVP